MLLEVYDITPLRNFFDVVYNTTEIVEMKLDASKLSISLLNKSHVAFYSLEIQKDFFGDYEVTDGESVFIFVEDFYKILKSAHKDDVLYQDFNGDGVVNTADGQALLDYATGVIASLNDMDNADVDGDGDVDSHDAYVFLRSLSTTTATLPANGAFADTGQNYETKTKCKTLTFNDFFAI